MALFYIVPDIIAGGFWDGGNMTQKGAELDIRCLLRALDSVSRRLI